MSKPIKLTEELINKIKEEFVESIKKTKLFDGKLNYSRNFKWDDENDRASVVFTNIAFAKMMMLVHNFTTEVAWHGVAFRDEFDPTKFHITDILVYPQVVSGATVNTDQEEYQTWLYKQEDEVFNNIRMQGHSHVDFGVTPSGVDNTHQEQILSQIDDDMFYIFMIWNKKYNRTVKIFDMENNTLYETDDIDVYIGDDGCDLDEFLKDAKSLVKTATYKTPASTGYSGSQKYSKSSEPAGKSQKKTDVGRNYGGYDYGYSYDYDSYGYCRNYK